MNLNSRLVNKILADINSTDPPIHCDSPAELGKRLKELCEKRKVSQRQLAFPGCSAAYLSRIESGDRQPTVQQLDRIAIRLYTTVEYLAHGLGPQSAPPTASIVRRAGKDRQLYQKLVELTVELRAELVRTGSF